MKKNKQGELSPLFWPVELQGTVIRVLDETQLPQRVSYLAVKDYKGACAAIRQMKTRAVGQVLLVLYTFLLEERKYHAQKNVSQQLEKVAQALNTVRPTLSFRMLTDMVLFWLKQGKGLEQNVFGFLEGLKQKRIQQAQEAAGLLKDNDCVLTHCNVSGLMPMIGDLCREGNQKISFIVTETRPYLQGSRLTAWELARAQLPVTVIADNMAAQVMSEGKVNAVIVGADHLAQNGDIANKIGTYQIAIVARHFNVPFYVLCPPASKSATGRDITIEVRPDKELLEFNGVRIAPRGVQGYYPAFDVTPAALITKHIYLPFQ